MAWRCQFLTDASTHWLISTQVLAEHGLRKGFGSSCEARVFERRVVARLSRKPNSSTMNLATIGPFLCFEKPLLTGYRCRQHQK